MSSTPTDSLGTVEKAIDVLFHLHEVSAPQGVTAIGRSLGMPKSSVHRLLAALVRRGLVERNAVGHYRPGMALVALGVGVLDREPVVVAARPSLEAFAREVGETFFLVAARAGRVVVLDKAEGTGFMRAAPRVGESVPPHATAVGKLYLAFAPDQLADDAMSASGMQAFSPETITDIEKLRGEVASVSERHIAINRDEWIPGLSVLAAPVWLGDRMTAAVALAAPSPRLDALGEGALAERVTAAAAEITDRLAGGSVGRRTGSEV